MRLLSPWREGPPWARSAAVVVGRGAAGGEPRPVGRAPEGGSIVAAVEGEPTSVDPAFDYDFVSGLRHLEHHRAAAEVLRERHDSSARTSRATGRSATDGLTYTLTIRDGVHVPRRQSTMTVDDVVFSLNRIRDPEPRLVRGLDARQRRRRRRRPDEHTVVITMSQPDALLEYALASTAAHVVSKAFVEAPASRLRHARRGLHRHRPLQVRGVGQRRPPDARPQRRLLGQGQRRPVPR